MTTAAEEQVRNAIIDRLEMPSLTDLYTSRLQLQLKKADEAKILSFRMAADTDGSGMID